MKQIVCAFFLCLWCGVSSQDTTNSFNTKKEPITSILDQLESKFNIQFSYLDSVVRDQLVTLNTKVTLNIDIAIRLLQMETGLKFQKVDTSNIIVRKYNSNDQVDGCGYVLGDNSKPLKNVKILIDGALTEFSTDKNGYFSIKDINYGVPITFVFPESYPYAMNSLVFAKGGCATIKIQNKSTLSEVLDVVLIQDYIGKGIVKNKNYITIKTKELDVLPGLVEPDILQSIQLTPGVNSPFETATGLYIRGSTPNQNLILWNGIKTYNQGHLFGLLSAFNPYIVEETNFYKSGVNAQYGDRVSGVVDIKTSSDVATDFNGGAGFNMINADSYLSVPIIKDRLSLQISGRRSYTDYVQTPTFNQFVQRVFQNTKLDNMPVDLDTKENDFFFGDYNINLVGQLSERNKIQLNTIYSKNSLKFKTGNEATSFSDVLEIANEGYHLQWEHDRTNMRWKVASYYTNYLFDYQFVSRSPVIASQIEEKRNSIREYGTDIMGTYEFNSTNTLTAGYQFSRNAIRYGFETTTPSFSLLLDEDDSVMNTHAIYSEFVHNTPGNLNVTFGVRANSYNEIKRTTIEPRLFLKKYLTPSFSLNITGEYRSQSVSQIQESVVSDLALENDIWTLVNTDATPLITSYQYSLGSAFKKNSWMVDVDGYYKEILDITTRTAGFLAAVDNSVQVGNSTVNGLDVFIKKDLGRYNSWVSYAYINSRSIFDNLNSGSSFRSNTNIEHTLRWSHFYTYKNVKLALGWLWHTGKAYTELTDVEINEPFVLLKFNEINGADLPVYHRLDFSLLYDFKIGRRRDISYRIGGSILNIYNKKNLINKEFRTTNTLNNQFIQNEETALGITPNISFRIFW